MCSPLPSYSPNIHFPQGKLAVCVCMCVHMQSTVHNTSASLMWVDGGPVCVWCVFSNLSIWHRLTTPLPPCFSIGEEAHRHTALFVKEGFFQTFKIKSHKHSMLHFKLFKHKSFLVTFLLVGNSLRNFFSAKNLKPHDRERVQIRLLH